MGSYQHKDVRPNDSTVDGNKVGLSSSRMHQ